MGAHFYCITIGGLGWHKTVWPGEPIEREKGRGSVGSWKSQFCKYWAHHSPSLPTIAAQLLGEPAAGEPDIEHIIYFLIYYHIISFAQKTI
jgi:hypothetical protein